MRRALVCIAAAALVVLPVGPVRAGEAVARDASARASVLFARFDVQPAFDPAWADSRASSSNIGAVALNSSLWPGFLADAFFFLYGFQSVERVALGIAEARFPQGPEEADATQSNLLFLNAGSPDMVPGRFGRAYSRANAARASGDVATKRIDVPGGSVGASKSSSSVETDDRATSVARQQATDLAFGPLRIDSITGTARAAVDGEASASATLTVVGAEIAGIAVEITEEGARATTATAQDAVDRALEGSGVTVRLLPSSESADDGAAAASSGGVLVLAQVEREDPTGNARSVVVGYLFGAADASARTGSVVTKRPTPPSVSAPPRVVEDVVTIPGARPRLDAVSDDGTRIIRRTIVITGSARAAVGARGAYAAIMLAALAALLVRPLVRAAGRT